MNDNKKLREIEQAFEEYKKKKIEIIDKKLKLKGAVKAKFYYPITKLLLELITVFNKEHIYYLNERIVKTPKGRSIIYANTHKFKPDIEKITLSLNKPSVMIASDFKNSYKTINGWYFSTRPTIFVDPYSKEDKNYTYKMMVEYLKDGNNCMIFPEAVWNLSDNKIVLETFFGTVRAALESNSVIVCTAIERYGKKYIINRDDYLDVLEVVKKYGFKSFNDINNYPDSQNIKNQIIKECNEILRDKLATLTYEIWEYYAKENGLESRKDIPTDYWPKFVKSLTDEWKGYKLSDNDEQKFQSKKDLELQEIILDINKIKNNLNIDNLFLFANYDRYLKAKEVVNEYEKVKIKKYEGDRCDV